MSRVSLAEQIACVKRVLRMRAGDYPSGGARGVLTAWEAEHDVAALRSVLETLEALAAIKSVRSTRP